MELRMPAMEPLLTKTTTEAKTHVNGWITMDLFAYCLLQAGGKMEGRELRLVPLKTTH